MTRSPRLRALVLGIALTLAAPAAWAEPHPAQKAYGPACNLVAQLWHALTAGWPGLVLWNDNGCSIDPDGLCAPGPADLDTADADSGCSLDPSGLCGG